MSETIPVTQEDIFHQVKLSCEIPETIEKIIERKIIISAAEAENIQATKEELQKASDQMRAMSKLKDAEATWVWLKKYGLSLEDFEEIVRISLLSEKLCKHLFGKQVEPYFYERQLDYAYAVIYEIILDDDEDEAIELFYEIQEGDISFYDAAQQYVQDTELRRQGGYRGKVSRSSMKPEVSAAVFAAEPGKLLKPIITADGVYLVLVVEIIQPTLDQKLRQKIMMDLYTDWLKQQMEQVQAIYQNEAVTE
ncbi:MAG: hypothetical protein RLZZ381_493 [Cyanobacteriota bacterium]|jgi:parvulin-like peptidyl-prolyl isomerase